MRRLKNVLIALDQFLWVLLTLGNGMPDETISAALWRMESQGKWAGRIFRPMVDWLASPWEDLHCWRAWHSEQTRNQLPRSYRA